MTGEKDSKAEWFQEFQKANARSSYPLTPSPQPAVGGKGQERRQHPRFPVEEAAASLSLKKFPLFGFRRAEACREALDLSEGGARLLSGERVPPGTRAQVRIQIGKFRDSIEGEAEIRWCHQKAGREQDFLLGVMFVKIDAERARKIAAMRGYFLSPQFQAARGKRSRGKNSLFPT